MNQSRSKIGIVLLVVSFVVIGLTVFMSRDLIVAPVDLAEQSQPARELTIGVFYDGDGYAPVVVGFKDGLMKKIGEDKNIRITYKTPVIAGDSLEVYARTIRDLVATKPDMILAIAPDIIGIVQKETVGTGIPVVYAFGGDPVDSGFVRTMEHSGNNLTGVTWNSWDLSGKRIEILKRAVPSMKNVLVIGKQGTASQISINAVENVKRSIDLNIELKLVKDIDDLVATLAAIDPKKIDGLSYATDPFIIRHIDLMTQTAIDKKIPFIVQEGSLAEAGALMSYGSEFYDAGVQLSGHAKKILVDGVSPNDIPSEAIKNIQMVLNNDTATRIDVAFPEEILAIANKVVVKSTP